MNCTTWYYAYTDGGSLAQLPARIPEFGFRGELERAGAPVPAWVSEVGGIRVVGVTLLVEDHRALGVIGAGHGYLPVYRDSTPSIQTPDSELEHARRLCATAVIQRAAAPMDYRSLLEDFLGSHPIVLPIRRALEMGDSTPWLVYSVWESRVQDGELPYFDLRQGIVVGSESA